MFKRLLEGASTLAAFVAGGALVLMMLHINLDVALRYLFSAPLANTIEIVSTYYIVAIVFLPLAMVELLNAHIVVEILSQHLPKRAAEILISIVGLASAVYFTAFTLRSWEDAVQKYSVGEMALGNSQITVWPTRFYLPIGCGLLVLVLLYKSWRLMIGDNTVLNSPGESDRLSE
ncbi:MAG: TRAP transporter small permease [Hyphomicrobiaceae bacterium]